jgi:hypothetical protein
MPRHPKPSEGSWTAHYPELGTEPVSSFEATQMGLESQVVGAFPLNDQEILCRHLHKEVADWVDEYARSHI